MSAAQPLAVEKRGRDTEPPVGSCSARVLILIDIANLPAAAETEKRANGDASRLSSSSTAAAAPVTAGIVDGLRLGVLRVITQLCLSCPLNSWVEWAPRFFDSRHGGVGKTPAELKARLRTRQVAQGVRGFRKVTQASFRAFGDACLAIAYGIQGDPLARDRETALRRWAHGQKKHPARTQSQRSEPGAAAGASAAPADVEDSRKDITMRMYDGHDMSSHEVVVRSLLEVLQEFDDASDGDRTAAPSMARATSGRDNNKLQLLLLHSAFPHTDDEAEQFAVRGNFTAEAASIDKIKPSDDRVSALDGLLNAHLGKAVVRAASRGISFIWQEAIPSSSTIDSRGFGGVGPARRESCLYRCLSASGGAGILRWGRVVGSTGLLPPSTTLGRQFELQGSDRLRATEAGEGDVWEEQKSGTVVAVALNRRGDVDVNLVVATPSGTADSHDCSNATPAAVDTASCTTPWRLMGTVPIGEVWPSCLAGQDWGATRIVRADGGRGAQLWRDFLRELLVAEKAGVMALPQRLFRCNALPNSGGARKALTVAVLVPVSGECAVCFSAGGLAATPAGENVAGSGRLATAQQQLVLPEVRESAPIIDGLSSVADERGASGAASGGLPPTGHSCDGPMRAELELKRRGVEVGFAMQQASLARKRRRQAKKVPGKGARGMNLSGSSIAGAEGRGVGSGGGQSGSLSHRGSGSLCFTAEGASGDGAAYDARQWRLEMASVTSHGSASPRGYRLFDSTPGSVEDDGQMSSSGSSSGPKRALCQALEDVSSRSSLLGPDADTSSTPGSKEGARWSAGAAAHGLDGDSTVSRSQQQSPTLDDAGEAGADLGDVVDTGTGELPLSLMCEPALACLPGVTLPVELVALGERCAVSNRTMAATAVAATAAVPAAGGTCNRTDLDSPSHRARPRGIGIRQKFVDAIRSAERRRQAAAAATTVPTAVDAGTAEEPLPTAGHVPVVQLPSQDQSTPPEVHEVGLGRNRGENQSKSVGGDGVGSLEEGACLFKDGVGRGVTGLQMQYREIVEGGHRSPVEFVVCAVPEVIRDMTDGGKGFASVGNATDDRHVRAAQVLAAVVSGLTSTPKELSSKHRVNRNAGASVTGTGAGAAVSTAAAKPAMQKIRDYQLQALLLCQLNTLAMDLPETPESLAAFSSLAAGEMVKGKKGKGKGKGKGKKRRREGGRADESGAPARPSDPLPDCRRTRLVDYLQPISTMLDACTVTKPPPLDDGANGGGGRNAGDKAKGFQSRAYDGTLADFMGLALVEHFASRLPRTLGALFEDFECHPPDALTAALTGTPTSASCAATGGAVAVGNEAGGGPSKETDAGCGDASATAKELSAAGTAPKIDRGGSSSNSSSTAGILLSDRTAMSMSHNHFKMSGVLNGFREVKIKGHTAAGGGLRPSVLGRVSGNDQGGRDAHGSAASGESGGWRTSNGGGESRRIARSRATRDSKQAAGPGKTQQSPTAKPPPTAGIRQSPRLNRKRPNGDADAASGAVDTAQKQRSASGSKRLLPLAASTTAASVAVTPSRKRCRAAAGPGGGIPRARAGVLVGETPKKRLGAGAATAAAAAVARSSRRAARTSVAASPASPAAARAPARKSSKKPVPEEAHIPASPNLPMGSPAAGPKKRPCRAKATGPASPAESLFVAESPGVSTGSVRRRGRAGWASGVDGDKVSRQLMAESGSPVGRRSVVPGTPA